MPDFSSYFLLDTESAKAYAVEALGFFPAADALDCAEIGDGNINYVFRVVSRTDGRSLILKQADRLLRSSGRPLDMGRSRIEAAVLRLEGELAPGLVPAVYRYDETMSLTAMEDVSAFRSLRRELTENRVYPHLAEKLSDFLAATLLPSTDLVLDAEEKKRRVQFFTNPELCKITEDLVLTEPYYNYKGRNILFPGTERFVEEKLYRNDALQAEVAKLRLNFMNNAQALLHGDLHTGSIFANETGIRVLDAEFAFYGPMGYDIGNVIGNLFFSRVNKAFTMPQEAETIAALEKTLEGLWDLTLKKLAAKYDALVTLPLYRLPAFRDAWLDSVMADAAGYAGTELIRRTVGDSKVSEVTDVTDPALRVPMERALIELGAALIQGRRVFSAGAELTARCRDILVREA